MVHREEYTLSKHTVYDAYNQEFEFGIQQNFTIVFGIWSTAEGGYNYNLDYGKLQARYLIENPSLEDGYAYVELNQTECTINEFSSSLYKADKN